MTHIIIPRISPLKSFSMKVFVLVLLSALLVGSFALGRSSILDKYFPELVEKIIVVEEKEIIETNNNELLLLEKII